MWLSESKQTTPGFFDFLLPNGKQIWVELLDILQSTVEIQSSIFHSVNLSTKQPLTTVVCAQVDFQLSLVLLPTFKTQYCSTVLQSSTAVANTHDNASKPARPDHLIDICLPTIMETYCVLKKFKAARHEMASVCFLC